MAPGRPVAEQAHAAVSHPQPRRFERVSGIRCLQGRHLPRRADRPRLVGVVLPPRRRALPVAGRAARRRPRPSRARHRPHRRDVLPAGRGQPRRRRAHGADRARPRRAGGAHALVVRPDVRPDRRARGLPAPASGSIGRHQHAARPAVAPGRADQDAGGRRSLPRTPIRGPGRPAGCPTATRTCTAAASTAGTARSVPRRWAWRRSSCARCA